MTFSVVDWRKDFGIDAEPSYALNDGPLMMSMGRPAAEVPEYEVFDCGDVAVECYAIMVGDQRFCFTRWA